MYKNIKINKNEIGILFKNNAFESFLTTGKYNFLTLLDKYECEIYKLEHSEVTSKHIEMIRVNYPEELNKYVIVLEPKQNEVYIVYHNGRYSQMLTHGHVGYFWKEAYGFTYEKHDISDPVLSESELNRLRQKGLTNSDTLGMYSIPLGHKGLLYVDNKLTQQTDAGIYGIWLIGKTISFKSMDLRVTELEVTGQEVLTKDKVTIRMNVVCYFKVEDPEKAMDELQGYKEFLYKQVQFAIRQAVEARTIEENLNIREELNTELMKNVSTIASSYGLNVVQIGVKDIILPGEMRDIFNQVIQAEKLAQANLIKRREEVAATRSLLNTARMMEENPVLLRLKELEYTETILSKVENLSVYGGVEDIIGKLFTRKSKK